VPHVCGLGRLLDADADASAAPFVSRDFVYRLPAHATSIPDPS
jgi:hypothetical protein